MGPLSHGGRGYAHRQCRGVQRCVLCRYGPGGFGETKSGANVLKNKDVTLLLQLQSGTALRGSCATKIILFPVPVVLTANSWCTLW